MNPLGVRSSRNARSITPRIGHQILCLLCLLCLEASHRRKQEDDLSICRNPRGLAQLVMGVPQWLVGLKWKIPSRNGRFRGTPILGDLMRPPYLQNGTWKMRKEQSESEMSTDLKPARRLDGSHRNLAAQVVVFSHIACWQPRSDGMRHFLEPFFEKRRILACNEAFVGKSSLFLWTFMKLFKNELQPNQAGALYKIYEFCNQISVHEQLSPLRKTYQDMPVCVVSMAILCRTRAYGTRAATHPWATD